MSFFERAKAAANDLAAKADVAMTQAGINTPGPTAGAGGGGERALRDLGVLAYLEATGRPASTDDRARLMATLHELESSGRLGPLTVTPAAHGAAPGAPPPPPGAAAAAAGSTPPPPPPPPPGAHGTPPPAAEPTPPPPPAAEPTPPGSTPPPPPPSWA